MATHKYPNPRHSGPGAQARSETARCAIYTRVSTDEQAREGYSLGAQEERLRSHAKSQGWAVYKLYMDDGYSAASRNRPALKRLLTDAARGRFDAVLVYKIDRLSRSLKDLIDIVAELGESDVGFKSCTELIDTTRPEGRLMFHQFGSIAQYERELIGQRTRFGMMKRLRDGLWNGIPPFGYRIVDRRLVVEPEEAEWVRRVFTWYVHRNMGAVAICRELNHQGVQPRKGARWKATRVHKMLANPLYAGFIRWGGETVMGKHDPIVSQEVFDAVQGTRNGRQHKTRQLRSPNYLAGLVRCGLCGAPMHVTYPGDSAKSQYRYYVCNNRLNHQACGQDYIRADLLEATIIQEIAKLAERRDVITALVAEFVARAHKTVPELEQKRAAIIAERATLAQEKQNLSQWLLQAGISSQSVAFINAQLDERTEKETRLQEEQWGIEDHLAELQTRTYNAQGIADQLKEFARTFPDLDAGEKVLWMESLVESVTVGNNKGVTAVLRPPLPALGYLTPSTAPKGRRPQVPELRIQVEYSLAGYYHASACGNVDAQAPAPGTRYSLAPESESLVVGGGGDQPTGNGRSTTRGTVAQL